MAADLGIEKWITAERDTRKILVEIKTFSEGITIPHFYKPFGQYIFYREALKDEEIDREVYLAMGEVAYKAFSLIPFWKKSGAPIILTI